MIDAYFGMFVGAAIGDALGAPLEFKARDTYEHITGMISGGAHDLQKGYWTDDTSLMLCLSESLASTGKNDQCHQLDLYEKWYSTGYLSSTGRCFDIGTTTREAIQHTSIIRMDDGIIVNPLRINDDITKNGNGALMRIAPLIIKYWDSPTFLHEVELSTMATHAHITNIEACQFFSLVVSNAMNRASKDQLISNSMKHLFNNEILKELNMQTIFDTPRQDVSSSGYVLDTLHAALWSFFHTYSFKEAVLLAANLGDDSDTVACVTGILAGAYYGLSGIDEELLNDLYDLPLLVYSVSNLINSRN